MRERTTNAPAKWHYCVYSIQAMVHVHTKNNDITTIVGQRHQWHHLQDDSNEHYQHNHVWCCGCCCSYSCCWIHSKFIPSMSAIFHHCSPQTNDRASTVLTFAYIQIYMSITKWHCPDVVVNGEHVNDIDSKLCSNVGNKYPTEISRKTSIHYSDEDEDKKHAKRKKKKETQELLTDTAV